MTMKVRSGNVQSLDKSVRENVRHLTKQNHEHFCLGTVITGTIFVILQSGGQWWWFAFTNSLCLFT